MLYLFEQGGGGGGGGGGGDWMYLLQINSIY